MKLFQRTTETSTKTLTDHVIGVVYKYRVAILLVIVGYLLGKWI